MLIMFASLFASENPGSISVATECEFLLHNEIVYWGLQQASRAKPEERNATRISEREILLFFLFFFSALVAKEQGEKPKTWTGIP